MEPEDLRRKISAEADICQHLAELGAGVDLDGQRRRTLAESYAGILVGTIAATASQSEVRSHCRSLEGLIAGYLNGAYASQFCALLERCVVSPDVRVGAVKEILSMWRRLIKSESAAAKIYDALVGLPLHHGKDPYAVRGFRVTATAVLKSAPDARAKVLEFCDEIVDEVVSDPQLFAAWVETFNKVQGLLAKMGIAEPWLEKGIAAQQPVRKQQPPAITPAVARTTLSMFVSRLRRFAAGLVLLAVLSAVVLLLSKSNLFNNRSPLPTSEHATDAEPNGPSPPPPPDEAKPTPPIGTSSAPDGQRVAQADPGRSPEVGRRGPDGPSGSRWEMVPRNGTQPPPAPGTSEAKDKVAAGTQKPPAEPHATTQRAVAQQEDKPTVVVNGRATRGKMPEPAAQKIEQSGPAVATAVEE